MTRKCGALRSDFEAFVEGDGSIWPCVQVGARVQIWPLADYAVVISTAADECAEPSRKDFQRAFSVQEKRLIEILRVLDVEVFDDTGGAS